MSKKVSQLYGMEIYTEKAKRVGRVKDVILNLEKGEIMQLALQSFKSKSLGDQEVRKILQEESIPYEDILRVGDVIICKEDPRKSS